MVTLFALAIVSGAHVASAVADDVAPPSLSQAATYYALGALDAAESEIRRFLASYPNDPRKDDAIRLLAEIRIERERAHAATTGAEHSGATSNVQPDRSDPSSTPRIVDPRVLSSPPAQVLLKWERAFPGEPAQYRKDGVYAVTAVGVATKTTIHIYTAGGTGEMAQQRSGTMLILDIPGLADALPRGGLDLPQGPVSRVRHSQLSEEPLVARVVIDLKSTDVKATVTSGDEEITIELEEPASATDGVPQGGLYRAPVAGQRHIMEILSGSLQRGFVVDPLTEPLAVRVVDPVLHAPMANVAVEFRAVDVGVKIASARVLTTADGVASTRVTLDEIAGRKVIAAAIPGTPAEVSFEVYALPRPPDSIRKISGEDVKVRTRQTATTPLTIVVQDQYGNPIPGVVVEWKYVQGNGVVDADPERAGDQSTIETDRDGKAVLRQWSTGPRAGTQRVQASFTIGDVTKFTQFEIEVTPQLVSMDFYQTAVPDILRFLGRIANWNLLLSDGVGAIADPNITVHLENVPIDEALDKILQMKNLTRIEESDGSIRIVTFVEAQTRGQAVITDATLLTSLPQNVVRTVIVSVRRRNMEQMTSMIQGLLTPEAKVMSDPATGQLVITDFVVNIRRALDVVDQLERGMETRLFRLQHVDPKFLQEYLRNFLTGEEKLYPLSGAMLFVGSIASADHIGVILQDIDKPENVALFTQAGAAGAAPTGPVVINMTGIDPTVLQNILTTLYPGIRIFPDVATGRIIIFVAPAIDTAAIMTMVDSLRVVTRGTVPPSPLIISTAGIDQNVLLETIRSLYPGVKVVTDVTAGRIVLFLQPDFDTAVINSAVESLRTVPHEVTLRTFVINSTGIEPSVLTQVLSTVFPSTKLIIDATSNRFILFVDSKTDTKPIFDLVESLRTQTALSAALRAVIVPTAGVDPALFQTMLTTLYPGIKITADPANGRLILFVPEGFDDQFVTRLREELTDTRNSGAGVPRLVTLKYVAPADFISIMTTVYPQMRPFQVGRNDAVLVFEPAGVNRATALRDVIDRPATLQEGVARYDILRLVNRDANTVKTAIEAILRSSGRTAGGGARPNAELTLTPIADANILVVTGGTPEERELVRVLSAEVDTAPFHDKLYVQLYAFRYILPSEFERFLTATVVDEQTLRRRFPAVDGEPAYTITEFTTNAKRIPIDSLKLLIVRTERTIHQQISDLIALIDTPGFGSRLELRARNYPVNKASLDVIANIITRQALNQLAGSADEFLIIDRAKRELVIWAREGAHTKIERLLPVYDRAEIQYDPDDEFDSYVLQYVSLPLVEAGIQIIAQIQGILGEGRVVYSAGGAAGNFVLMWGNRSALSRAKETLRRLDMAVKDQVGGETNVRFVEVRHRPVSELLVELRAMWGLNTNLVPISRDEGSPRNGIMIFVPHAMLSSILKTIDDLDTEIPTRVFRSSYLHTADLTTLGELFPDLKFITAGGGAGVGFEMMVVQGSRTRLDELSRLWATLDTPGRIVLYSPVNRPADVLLASLQEFIVSIGAIATPSATGNAPEVIVLYGDVSRVNEALAFLKQIDKPGDFRLLTYGRLPGAEAQALVTAFYPGVHIESLSNGSILAASGNTDALAAVEKLLSDIEHGLEWRVVPLARMSSVDAIALVNGLFSAIKVTPLPAGNGVAMLGTPTSMGEAIRLIEQIDRRAVTLVPVREADLATIANAVITLFPEAKIEQMPAISSLAISADSDLAAQIVRFAQEIDRKVFTAIRPLKHYDPVTTGDPGDAGSRPTAPSLTASELSELMTTLKTYLSTTGTLFFDRQSNSFVITDALEKVERVLRVIDDLDRTPPQFIIEAVIAEVATTDDKQLGIAWASSPDLTGLGFRTSVPVADPTASGARADFNGTFTLGLARNNLTATITALLAKNDARIVATPKIVTRNNVQGVVNIQQSFPVTTTTPGAVGVAPQTTVTFQQVPIILTVTPSSTWNSDDIRLTVAADISVAGAQTITGAVNVSSRQVNTTVDMKDGQTLIIGGLMQKTKNELITKIPILGDLPGIGSLFRNTTASEVNSEVLIFLSPRVLYPQAHDLQMEEELNRYKYLVNFPADWSGRRFLINNPQRSSGLRQQMNQGSNFIVAPAGNASTAPASSPIVPEAVAPASIAPPAYTPPTPPVTPAYTPTPQPQSSALIGASSTVDVNSATSMQLRGVPGMPAHVAELIVKFREANGAYRSLGDLIRVPGMTAELLDQVSKYLRISSEPTPMAPVTAPAYTPPSAYQPPITPVAAPTTRINLNTATVEELKTLPGIADNNARMIVAYRNTYGQFTTIDQLIDVPGISAPMFGRVREFVTVSGTAAAARPSASTPVAPPVSGNVLNINTASEAELTNVGFSAQQSKLIVTYRNSYGSFGAVDELLDVPTITESLLSRLRNQLSTTGGSGLAPRRPSSSATTSGPVVNLNTATEAELMAIPGFNTQNVKLIISYRTTYGAFNAVEDLLEVPSITPEILAQVRGSLIAP